MLWASVHKLATGEPRCGGKLMTMQDDKPLTVKQTATGYWVVQSGAAQISGAVTRQAAEAERDLMRRLRRRTATMRSAAPHRPRVIERLPR